MGGVGLDQEPSQPVTPLRLSSSPAATARSEVVIAATRYNQRMRAVFQRTLLLVGSCLITLAGRADQRSASPAQVGAASAKELDYGDAQRFVLSLVNRDRAKAGLSPVVLDEAASRAGLRHARDMASNGFTGHIGSDGSVPEQRYTESGGSHFVQENAACLFDTEQRKLDPKARFSATKLSALHQMFMDEVPPNDGHRRNILAPLHNRVGIGIAQPAAVNQPCLTQEFVDKYGEYEPLPREAKAGAKLRVAGTISAPLVFGGIGLGHTPPRKAPPREHLNGNRYPIPAPDTLYFPAGFKTPKPVKLDGEHFSIDLDLGATAKSGNYAVSVWAKRPNSTQLFMVSLRTVGVR